jgi:hypothetical protein
MSDERKPIGLRRRSLSTLGRTLCIHETRFGARERALAKVKKLGGKTTQPVRTTAGVLGYLAPMTEVTSGLARWRALIHSGAALLEGRVTRTFSATETLSRP